MAYGRRLSQRWLLADAVISQFLTGIRLLYCLGSRCRTFGISRQALSRGRLDDYLTNML